MLLTLSCSADLVEFALGLTQFEFLSSRAIPATFLTFNLFGELDFMELRLSHFELILAETTLHTAFA